MSITLTDLCQELNNWFDTNADGEKDRLFGKFTIVNGYIDLSESDIKVGQYFRIIGSVFNDGVYQYSVPEPEEDEQILEQNEGEEQEENNDSNNAEETSEINTGMGLVDEEFEGAIWIMYVPPQVFTLLEEVNEWNDKYGPIVASPFNSESFGGYSYYKGYKNTMSTVASSWKSKFAEAMQKWRKLRNI